MPALNDKIYDLILRYLTFGKKVDNDFFYELVKIVVDYESLQEYVKYLSFDETFPGGVFSFADKSITISKHAIKLYSKKVCDKFQFSKIERDIAEILISTSLILHELEHASQTKLLSSGDNGLESKILSASNLEYHILSKNEQIDENSIDYLRLLRWQKTYLKYYEFSPEERMADLNSFKKCYALSKCFDKMTLRLDNFFLYSIYRSCLSGYDKENNPTKFYISKINPGFCFKKIDDLSSDVLEYKKISYGLEVDENYKTIIRLKKSLLLKDLRN